ncbi:N-acetylmuramoyl-L-alanine amidase [Aestuariibacter halophilus]|uniref:N-acetylmuramoyl-L-alanine amidase n=1 Tax=Fluctibacter halophilus TaxID=226011 RepID=A0ABS8GB31_9ALTE|nr:N-acetylmuramoyl-L-alanine amidase [Aestuariibacter halophilus]MCC2617708.1 N-acetylmuramoyl-L-alanine amidase [Aestuariibacter halophilus]
MTTLLQRLVLLFSWLSLLGFGSVAWAQNEISGVRIWPSPTNTRLVFDMAKTPDYSYFTLNNPRRLVIDLADTDRDIDFAAFDNDSDLIRVIRHSTPKNDRAVRVVIELSKAVNTDIFALPPTPPYRNRLVIDLTDPDPDKQTVVMRSDEANQDRDIIIAIDAGHGGEDPGSIGRGGTYEKNITLSVAKKLQALVDAQQGMRAVMTRTGDYYISPNERPELARKHKADLFVSIHADAFTTPQPSGASVWVLSMSRANTELGRWMEKSERHSELLGGAAQVIEDTASERYLAQALLDMSMDHSMSTSYDLSKRVIREMRAVTKMHKKTPQAASLAVLTSPDIPSILVETGFISNPREEKNLNWAQFRQRLADAMFNAIQAHFKRTPPDGTLWAKLRNLNRTHKVQSGESLSLLAQRYNVRVSEIKAANNLTSDMVRIGQVLTIPSI